MSTTLQRKHAQISDISAVSQPRKKPSAYIKSNTQKVKCDADTRSPAGFKGISTDTPSSEPHDGQIGKQKKPVLTKSKTNSIPATPRYSDLQVTPEEPLDARELIRRYEIVESKYHDSRFRKDFHALITAHKWSIDRIIIIGLGTHLVQLAQITDLAALFKTMNGGKTVEIFAQDPIWGDEEEDGAAFFVPLLDHQNITMSPIAGRERFCIDPFKDYITPTTLMYAPYPLNNVSFRLLTHGNPRAWLGTNISDCGIFNAHDRATYGRLLVIRCGPSEDEKRTWRRWARSAANAAREFVCRRCPNIEDEDEDDEFFGMKRLILYRRARDARGSGWMKIQDLHPKGKRRHWQLAFNCRRRDGMVRKEKV